MQTKPPSLYPLTEFYSMAGLPMPQFEIVPGEAVPSPQHQLLVHQNDMTPTVEEYYQKKVHIIVKQVVHCPNYLLREVTLAGDDELPLVSGAIRINLDLFDTEPRAKIKECREPLGGILRDFNIPHSSHPKAFFRIKSDDIINESLQLNGPRFLFGRVNRIVNADQQPLVEVVEILPG